MKKFDLINIEEENLPKVNLDINQKESISKSLRTSLDKFYRINPNIEIDTSYDKISSIENDCDKSKHGVNNVNILKELVLDAIENSIDFNPSDIVYKCFLQAGAGQESSGAPTFMSYRGSYYYQLYILKNSLFIYSLDEYFRVINKTNLPFINIKSVHIEDRDLYRLKLSNKNLIIEVTQKNNPYASSYYFVEENPNEISKLLEIQEILYELGIKKYKARNISPFLIFYIILIIFIVFIFGLSFIMTLI